MRPFLISKTCVNYRDVRPLSGETGHVGVQSQDDGPPDALGLAAAGGLHADLLTPAEVEQLLPHLGGERHLAEVDKVLLAPVVLVAGRLEGAEHLQVGNVVALGAGKLLPGREHLLSLGGRGRQDGLAGQEGDDGDGLLPIPALFISNLIRVPINPVGPYVHPYSSANNMILVN